MLGPIKKNKMWPTYCQKCLSLHAFLIFSQSGDHNDTYVSTFGVTLVITLDTTDLNGTWLRGTQVGPGGGAPQIVTRNFFVF